MVDFLKPLHRSTKRDYLERVTEHDKAECTEVAKLFERDYFDGDRKYGYGGYRYDGRWETVARNMIEHYRLGPGSRILDIGCAKGYLLYEIKKLLPESRVRGIDISSYAIANGKEEVREDLLEASAQSIPFPDNSFDLIISLNTLHNLYLFDFKRAVSEISRVTAPGGDSYIVVESYRSEREKTNLLYWQLTCELLFTPKEWEWLFAEYGYTGDLSFIFFE